MSGRVKKIGENKWRVFMGMFRGQGATEYLVLLAVVLIVALVSVALLGFFPGMASDARITQSQSYWRGQARPFAIIENSMTGTTGTLVIQNMEANGPYTITASGLGVGIAACTNTTAFTFGAGQTQTITLASCTAGTSGAVYDLGVNISYTTPNGVTSKEYGTKKMIVKYV